MPRYSEFQNVSHNVLFNYFNISLQHTSPAEESNVNTEIELVLLSDGQTTSTDELQTIRGSLAVNSPSSSKKT